MAKKSSGAGKDYGYGQQEGEYIKPQKRDGKYWVYNPSGSLQEISKPVGKSSDAKNSVAAKRLTKQVYGRAMPKGTQPKGVTSPPRTGPSSGGGGQSARYNRLTGGLKQHGR